jgi:hypothetical protein
MGFQLAQYSRKKTRDLRSAMAMAIRTLLEGIEFTSGTGPIRFRKVFEEWPTYDDKFVTPSACVLPGQAPFAPSRIEPTLIESTVEPPLTKDGDMLEPGFGLWAVAEIDAMFEIQVRAPSRPERQAVVGALEDLWQETGIASDGKGPRRALLLAMPEYYGLDARFSLQSARLLDDEDRALRNYREAIISLSGQARQVVLRAVRPLKFSFRLDPDDP